MTGVQTCALPIYIHDCELTPNDFKSGITLQPKLNGIRAVFDGKELYSRTGKTLPGKAHIISALMELKKRCANMPSLDGELYLHGEPLNYISGQARKENDEER